MNNTNTIDQSTQNPGCKVLGDYVYNFADKIGKGMFGEVFKGYH